MRGVFVPASVLLVEAAPQARRSARAGIADSAFARGEVPMTKQEVRAAALGKLACARATSAGTWRGHGSVSVELALAAHCGRVYAVECEADACALIRRNRSGSGRGT